MTRVGPKTLCRADVNIGFQNKPPDPKWHPKANFMLRAGNNPLTPWISNQCIYQRQCRSKIPLVQCSQHWIPERNPTPKKKFNDELSRFVTTQSAWDSKFETCETIRLYNPTGLGKTSLARLHGQNFENGRPTRTCVQCCRRLVSIRAPKHQGGTKFVNCHVLDSLK